MTVKNTPSYEDLYMFNRMHMSVTVSGSDSRRVPGSVAAVMSGLHHLWNDLFTTPTVSGTRPQDHTVRGYHSLVLKIDGSLLGGLCLWKDVLCKMGQILVWLFY